MGNGNSLFEVIGEDERLLLLSVMRRRRFARGEVIYHQGDPGDAIHIVEKGHISFQVASPLGDQVILDIQQPGDVFGLGGMLIPDHRRIGSAVALTKAETRSLAWSEFEKLRRTDPGVEQFMSELLAVQMRRLMDFVLESLYVPVETRVLRRLDELCDQLGEVDGDAICITIRQDDIAAMAGTTRPTANRALRAAEGRGLLRLRRGRVDVLDRPALAARARRG